MLLFEEKASDRPQKVQIHFRVRCFRMNEVRNLEGNRVVGLILGARREPLRGLDDLGFW